MSRGSMSDSEMGWPPRTISFYLPPLRQHVVMGTTLSRPQKSKLDLKLQRRKGKNRELQVPTNSTLGLLLHFISWFSFSSYLSPTILYEVGSPAEGQIHPKASLGQKQLLKIFKEAGQEKKASKEIALSKENALDSMKVECGTKISRLKNECVPHIIYKNELKLDYKPKCKS